ncbi:glycosyltransferase family 2 protein, partial [Leuconostoc pseudomesenteroides]
MNQLLMIVTLMLIWLSLFISFVMLSGAIHFWFKNSHRIIETPALSRYPLITVVVPAHNEEIVIENTTRALLALNYPKDKVELLLYSDNSTDHTADRMRQAFADEQHAGRNYKIIERTGTGGKAGVLNDSLKIARGEFIAVYDADAMPEKNALYFLVQKALENPDRYMAVFGRNKTRNADQNYLTRFINQEI